METLKNTFACIDWTSLRQRDVDEAVDLFYAILEKLCRKYIPHELIQMKKQTHPWIDRECAEMIREKNLTEDTSMYRTMCMKCSDLLANTYKRYIDKLKGKILNLKKKLKL